MKFLRQIFGHGSAPPPPPEPVIPCPSRPVYAVGDVHGRANLLDRLLGIIDADAATHDRETAILVLVGDFIDRGEESAAVLARIRELAQDRPEDVICLMGNHERMMLDFLNSPVKRGPSWMRHGGLQTLTSFGLRGAAEHMPDEKFIELSADLRRALPEGMEHWLRSLPLSWRSGNLLAVHAAAAPDVAPEDQSRRTLLWGCPGFLDGHRADGIIVLHGHTVTDAAVRAPTRIGVDTGAYFSGRLTAASIGTDGDIRFLDTLSD